MKVGIIGCGNIGTKRARAIQKFSDDEIIGIVESNKTLWSPLQTEFNTVVTADPRTLIEADNVNAIIISTPPESHLSLIDACLENGKDVLCEKPLGETREGVEKVTRLAADNKRVLKCGFNLRHDAGLVRAWNLCQDGAIGKPYFFKCTYVNGCVRVNTNSVGALSDMGSHVLDIVRWFVGEPQQIRGFLQNTEYAIPNLDDNGFISFNNRGLLGMIHFSFIRWANQFQMEITGNKGTIEIMNLPKWGKQEVRIHQRILPSGVPHIVSESYEGDLSWENEWSEFRRRCESRDLSYNEDGLRVMQMIDTIRGNIFLTREAYNEN